jgi:N4-gp56 family major capsid protein
LVCRIQEKREEVTFSSQEEKMKNEKKLNLQLFADGAHANPFVPGTTPGTPTTNPVNRTTDDGWDPALRPFYNANLLENSRENNVFSQFAKKTTIKGSEAVWSKWNTFPKATTPLQEGVIPAGVDFGMTSVTARIEQYGQYTALSDRLEAESLYDATYGASEEMGASMGETKDTLMRNSLTQSTEVAYCPIVGADGKETEVNSESEITPEAILTSKMVNKVATHMKRNKVPKIDGNWIWILHPSVTFDLRESKGWLDAHEYASVKEIYNGEIGQLHGFRFVESTNCKIEKNGADGVSTYESYAFGKEAFGEVEGEGEEARMILKGKEYGGPLEQFSTVGYKFTQGTAILYPERLLTVISGSSLHDSDEAN